MPDISMCSDDDCPVRRACYRHQASGTVPKPTWQQWMSFVHDPNTGDCDRFYPIEERRSAPTLA